MKKIIFILFFSLISSSAISNDLDLGKEVATTICATCHGVNGLATSGGNSALTPNLAGQNKEYLIVKLKDYRSGKIKDHIMNLIAQNLRDDQIESVAAWYSSIKLTLEMPK